MYSFRAASASRCRPSAGVALTHAATQTAALQRVWSSYTVETLRCKPGAISQRSITAVSHLQRCCFYMLHDKRG